MFGKRSTETQPTSPKRAAKFGGTAKKEKTVVPLKPIETPAQTEAVATSVMPVKQPANESDSLKPQVDAKREELMERAIALTQPKLQKRIPVSEASELERGELARRVEKQLRKVLAAQNIALDEHEVRDAVTVLMVEFLDKIEKAKRHPTAPKLSDPVEQAKLRVQPLLLDRIDIAKATEMPREELVQQIGDIVTEILVEEKIQLNLSEQRNLITALLNDMLGLGPLEELLADEAVADIMVNGANQVYVERNGKLELTKVTFRDNAHVMNIAQRIVAAVGRRVDETTPLVDARLADGSRVNIIIPPLAIDGPTISIRKFSEKKITLDVMAAQANLSDDMARTLKIASRARLNILISGGTGSGKTTLLNALSQMIDHGERIVTIEDAAELQLQQPHVVRLETRPANLEGDGEITQTELVKNALRMRPDRIILGEIRAGEALDMLQAMNTGHDGSLGTIHANNPREALTRLENMVAMSGVKLPNEAVRAQIAGALDMIVQVSRMRDGVRRIVQITEVVGMEGEVITTQDLFTYQFTDEDADGRLIGEFKKAGLRPVFADRAAYFGLNQALLEATL